MQNLSQSASSVSTPVKRITRTGTRAAVSQQTPNGGHFLQNSNVLHPRAALHIQACTTAPPSRETITRGSKRAGKKEKEQFVPNRKEINVLPCKNDDRAKLPRSVTVVTLIIIFSLPFYTQLDHLLYNFRKRRGSLFMYWAQIANAPSTGSLSSSEIRGFVFDMTLENP